MCPPTCPTIHSSCDPATTTDGKCICDPGYSVCATACLFLASDQQNCGACGHVCDAANGYICINSNCICGAGSFGLCQPADGGDPACIDVTTDPHNCSYCGNDCGALQCSNGSCTCNSPLYECVSSSGAAYCADISRDVANCGGCGNNCGPGAAWQCVSTTGGPGICACRTGFFQCQANAMSPAECVDLSSDPQNCGACNNGCDGGPCTNSYCTACKGVARSCLVDADCCAPLHCDQNTNKCRV